MNQRKFKGLLAQTLAEEEGIEGCQLDFTIAASARSRRVAPKSNEG